MNKKYLMNSKRNNIRTQRVNYAIFVHENFYIYKPCYILVKRLKLFESF